MSQPCIFQIAIIDGPVSIALEDATPTGAGGICTFCGTTRPEHHPIHGPLQGLFYDVHDAMARDAMNTLAREAAERWPLQFVAMNHARGLVPIGSASVAIVVAAAHRAEAFAACRWLIDALKSSVPIWKQEVWTHGTSWSQGISLSPPSPGVSP